MKVVMEFIMPDDAHDYSIAYNAGNMLVALEAIQSHIRNFRKYSNGSHEELEKTFECIATIAYDATDGIE